ncbi:MAG TPA: DUF2332 family protein, partial [Alphaproteobacteria bacterium]|nr:DUF2332 family protein [Alphaproteobacteria bacterium]
MPSAVIDNFLGQAEYADKVGSPFLANLCRLLAAKLDHTTRFGRKILEWPGDPRDDALALRACAALHALALSGWEPELKAAYPPAVFDEQHLWFLIRDVLSRHDNFLAGWLDRSPQTNEVGRSALVLGAALHVVARTRLPIELLEIGASAGLNLRFDTYRYRLGDGRAWGPADSPLVIPCTWRGAIPPLSATVTVAARSGCDRNPIDPAVPDDANRLLAYVWPDQTQRVTRLQTALAMAREDGNKVERADAADWLEERLGQRARPGTVRMLFHTIVWQYLPPAGRSRIAAALARAGGAATDDTPIAHFAFEPDGVADSAAMTLTLWPGGRATRL